MTTDTHTLKVAIPRSVATPLADAIAQTLSKDLSDEVAAEMAVLEDVLRDWDADEIGRCECDDVDQDTPHACPFREDVWSDSSSLCTCCEWHAKQCADDI